MNRTAATLALLVGFTAGLLARGAGGREGTEERAEVGVYEALFEATVLPSERAARVSVRLRGAPRPDWVRFRIDPERHRDFRGDGEVVAISEDQVEWRPPRQGGTLRYLFQIDHLRDEKSYDARCASRWAVFRGDDLVPPARVRTEPVARSSSRLRLRLPEGWSAALPYPRLAGGDYGVSHPDRRFDRPTGWFLLGEIGARREELSGVRVTVAGPVGHGVRRLDILALLTWTLPTLRSVLGDLPERLLVVAADDPMWRGGLSGPRSVFVHADRPLIGEDGTSTLLHELMHTLMRAVSGKGGDWVSEGLAELYSLEVLHRSGTLSESRYQEALEDLALRAKKAGPLRAAEVAGDTRARAVIVLRDLDREIQQRTAGARRLDDVLRALARDPEAITTESFRAHVESVARASFESFFARHAPAAGPGREKRKG